jgi:uncharacterized membrane protein YqjE
MTTQDPRSIGTVLHSIVNNVESLVEAQLKLAKVELRAAMHHGGQAARPLIAGLVLTHLALLFVLAAGAMLLARVVAPWIAALIVAAVAGLGGTLLIGRATSQLVAATPIQARTAMPHGSPSHG